MLGGYRRELLPNGLRVLGVENSALHSFVCSAYIHAGPRFEPPEKTGLTHFLEHMLMQGSENFPRSSDIMRGVEDLGGVVDGQTYTEFLNVTFGVHRKHWERVMRIAADVLLRPLFDPEELEQEKSIVAQEVFRHRDRDGRNISVHELMYELLLKQQPEEAGTRGCPPITQTFDRAMLEAHYREFFVPQNMVLCLAGGFDFDEVLSYVAEQFGAMEAGDGVPELPPLEVGREAARSFYRPTEALPVAEAIYAHRAYPLRDDRSDALRAICQLLGGGLSSRLFARVREELGLVYEVQSYPQTYSDTGSANVYVSVSVENLPRALEAVLGVLEDLLGENFTEGELNRYKESARCGMEILCDHPSRLADWFGKQELFLGPQGVLTPEEYVAKQERLTLQDVKQVLRDLFAESGGNLAVVGPFDDDTSQAVQSLFPQQQVMQTAATGE